MRSRLFRGRSLGSGLLSGCSSFLCSRGGFAALFCDLLQDNGQAGDGSVARARAFAQKLGMSLAIVDKRRPKANSCEVMNIIGDVKGRDCILFDDMVDTAGSICNAAKAIIDVGGANSVHACASHAVLSGPALERLNESPINEMAFLNTIPAVPASQCPKIKYLSVAHMFADAIERIYSDLSVSKLFS